MRLLFTEHGLKGDFVYRKAGRADSGVERDVVAFMGEEILYGKVVLEDRDALRIIVALIRHEYAVVRL